MKDHIILYDFDSSPCSRRVKITLVEKGLDYRVQPIDLGKMQQKTDAYLRINPNGLVPTLLHNGRTLFESSVINDYLEDQFPQIPLSPRSFAGKCAAQQWQNHELAMARVYRPLMYARVMGPLHRIACTEQEFLSIAARATDNPAHLAWEKKIWNLQVLSLPEQQNCIRYLMGFADHVESALEGKTYLVEDRFSFADITLYPRMAMFRNIGVDLNAHDYPNIRRWMNRLSQRHSFQNTESERNKSVIKLVRMGIIDSINRALYEPEHASLKDKLVARSIKPLLRKALQIDEALKESESTTLQHLPKADYAEPSPMPVTSLKQSRTTRKPEKVKVYGFYLSPICQRIRLLLDSTGMEYEWQEVDMASNAHQAESYLAINPCAELPSLTVDQDILTDSLFIAEYLNGVCPQLTLFTDHAWELARIRLWHAFDMGFHKEFGVLFRHHLGTQPANASDITQAKLIFQEKFRYMENALENRDYLECDRLTYADIVMLTRITGLEQLGAGDCLDRFPKIESWRARVAEEVKSLRETTSQTPKRSRGKKSKTTKKVESV